VLPQEKPANWGLSRSYSGYIGPDSAKFPVNFPVTREFTVEIGSLVTAPTANAVRLLQAGQHFQRLSKALPAIVPTMLAALALRWSRQYAAPMSGPRYQRIVGCRLGRPTRAEVPCYALGAGWRERWGVAHRGGGRAMV
jgi:hypothetical protein